MPFSYLPIYSLLHPDNLINQSISILIKYSYLYLCYSMIYNANLYLALITQMKINPSVCKSLKGNFSISLSLRVSYAIATPLVGLALDSYHGGSMVITSKSLPPRAFYCLANYCRAPSCFTLTDIGIHQNCLI